MFGNLITCLICGVAASAQIGFYIHPKRPVYHAITALLFCGVSLLYFYTNRSLLGMLLNLAVVVLLCLIGCLLYAEKCFCKLYNFAIQLLVTIILLYSSMGISRYFSAELQQLVLLIITFVVNAIWVTMMYLMRKKVFTLMPMDETFYKHSLAYTVIGYIIFIVSIYLSQQKLYSVALRYGNIDFFLLLVITVILVYTLFYLSVSKVRVLRDRQLYTIQMQNQLLMQQAESNRERDEIVRQLLHDNRYQISTIRSLIDAGEYEQAKKFINDLMSNAAPYTPRHFCSSPLVDAILREADGRCVQSGIAFSVTVRLPDSVLVGETDISALMMNILNNAIEYVDREFNENGRYIEFALFQANEYLIIKCANPVKNAPVIVNGRIKTTKADDTFEHGIGLESIHYICQKYNGFAELSAENGLFRITAMIKNEKEIRNDT